MTTLDRHDRKLLARLRDEGPQFFSGARGERANGLYAAGLASREWRIYSWHPLRSEYRWRYSVTDAGRAAISPAGASGG